MDLFEYSDILNSPVEAFYCADTSTKLPVRSHWHYFVEMLYIEEGSITVNFNNLSYTLSKGDMMIIPPQTVHSIYQSTPVPFRYICIKFNARRIQFMDSYIPDTSALLAYIAGLKEPHYIFNDSDFEDGLLKGFFEKILSEVRSREYGYYVRIVFPCPPFGLFLTSMRFRPSLFNSRAFAFITASESSRLPSLYGRIT